MGTDTPNLVSSHTGLGRPPKATRMEIGRQLTQEDLALLGQDRGVRPPALKRITDMHHTVARLVAQGEAGYAISAATGYSESRISILKGDPAFQELVARYAAEVNEIRGLAFANGQAKLAAGFTDTVEIMHERVLEEGDLMPFRDLVDAAKFFADRAGFGPATKSQNLNVNVDLAEKLAAGMQRAEELTARVTDAKAEKKGPALEPPRRD